MGQDEVLSSVSPQCGTATLLMQNLILAVPFYLCLFPPSLLTLELQNSETWATLYNAHCKEDCKTSGNVFRLLRCFVCSLLVQRETYSLSLYAVSEAGTRQFVEMAGIVPTLPPPHL